MYAISILLIMPLYTINRFNSILRRSYNIKYNIVHMLHIFSLNQSVLRVLIQVQETLFYVLFVCVTVGACCIPYNP